ncbi:MAG: response regulator transcription factor [Actinobacteria bacterium]|nr:response regulator transcription factor [Actinomycetota bacterium]
MGLGRDRELGANGGSVRPAPGGDGSSVLLIEEDRMLADRLRHSFEMEDLRLTTVGDGVTGIERFRSDRPSLLMLELMLPRLSGMDVCRIIRAESNVPIIVVTARDSEADKVAALELGADDYVTKPFSMRELVSRVRSHLRRAAMLCHSVGSPTVLVAGPVEMDVARHEVRVRGERVVLTPKEFALLRTLIESQGRLQPRSHLISEVWGPEYFGDTKTLDVHVKRLRQKIERDPPHPQHLITVRGMGYRFLGEGQ